MNKLPANIYIDSENLVYQLVDVLVREKLIQERAELVKFDIVSLFMKAAKDDVQPIKILYYGTKLHLVKDMGEEALEASQKMITQKQAWDAWLAKQKIEFITAGNLKARQKKDGVVFQEKGVDVRIAVDMVKAAYENQKLHFIVATSDSDIIPALRLIAEKGHPITYVGFKEHLNKAIVAHVDNVVGFTRQEIIENYKKANAVKDDPKSDSKK